MGKTTGPDPFPEDPGEIVPMHPEDYAGLLAWVTAKEREKRSSFPS